MTFTVIVVRKVRYGFAELVCRDHLVLCGILCVEGSLTRRVPLLTRFHTTYYLRVDLGRLRGDASPRLAVYVLSLSFKFVQYLI